MIRGSKYDTVFSATNISLFMLLSKSLSGYILRSEIAIRWNNEVISQFDLPRGHHLIFRLLNELQGSYSCSHDLSDAKHVLFQKYNYLQLWQRWWCGKISHSKKKSTSEHLFWCFRLSQIEDSIEYPSSQRHTLPNQEYIHSNSEVIILNN